LIKIKSIIYNISIDYIQAKLDPGLNFKSTLQTSLKKEKRKRIKGLLKRTKELGKRNNNFSNSHSGAYWDVTA